MTEIELPDPEELEEVKAKAFTRRVALTTAVFAVLLAITSLGGNNAMKEMLLAQQQATDQWAFYQAKAIRQHFYHNEKTRLELDLLERGEAMKPEIKKQLQDRLHRLTQEEARYDGEKQEIGAEAKKLEHERDINRSKDPYFDYAEVLLQIAIVMASIAILSGSGPIYVFAIVAACLGSLLSINGFLLLVNLPFLH
jgi:hypothetical protein